jgi:hypothetical protein
MYQIIDDNIIKRLSDGVFIPINQKNVDYQKYLSWINAGNTPLPKE